MQKNGTRLLEDAINTGANGKLPKNKRLHIEPSIEGMMVRREKEDLAPVSIRLNNKEYKRFYQFGNRSSEKIVRANLGKFVEGVRAAVRIGLKEERLAIHPAKMEIANSIWDVEKICADFDGMDAHGFVDTEGKPLSQGKAFRNAIRQFFKDEEFAKAVCLVAVYDFMTGGVNAQAEKKQSGPKMNPGELRFSCPPNSF